MKTAKINDFYVCSFFSVFTQQTECSYGDTRVGAMANWFADDYWRMVRDSHRICGDKK